MSNEAYARVRNTQRQIWCVEFRHQTFPSALRFAEGNTDISFRLEQGAPANGNTVVTFIGVNLKVSPPAHSDEPDAAVSLEIIGVAPEANDYLGYANQTTTPIEVALRSVIANTVTGSATLVDVMYFNLRGASVNSTGVSCTLGRRNAANQAFPSIMYTPESNPSLY